ncbi:sensor histidine kinase [Mycolicibacterium sp. CBMA 226]|uniref:sensor histidine kinase n=1 Tax=Mycolicibacterium sp. CBMA 226 TaxID=2606611 RepID=UPI0012DDC96A|nr:ATP-binding protein [Mycolicibacterium sp. CBMA 226]MUL78769.1 ATP-binding protein [Mycolicibacterium sp. CBMA 226]QGW61061.1 hypothetical protein ICEMyc226_00029 [Mycolicibacterium sp.]
MGDAIPSDAARRNMLRHATTITLFMRHSANLIVSAVVVAIPPAPHAPAARLFAAALGLWSAYRLLTRSTGTRPLAVDYVCTVAACLATPILVSGPLFYLANSAPVAIAGTAVISFTIATPPRVSLALAFGIAAAFAAGSSRAVGWEHVSDIFNLYYFALQWVTAALIRSMVLRVADSVDAARTERVALELQHEVSAAVREYDREQMRLLHDTVASTLLMVGDGATLAPEQVAAHARRDLHVFSPTAGTPQGSTDLVAALRLHAEHTTTPITYTGLGTLWLDGPIAATVAAAAREALTNVDRHAAARAVTISVDTTSLRITDDGRGFDATTPTGRHGIARSITGRMHGIGGDAIITTSPGAGTTVELRWPATTDRQPPPDPERLIERTRTGYGLALTAYAIANLAAMVPTALRPTGDPHLQWVLAAAAAVATVSAIPRIVHAPGPPPRLGAAALLVVAVVQSVTLPVDQLGTQTQWSQGAIGWCVLPLVLGEPVRAAAAILISCWSVPAFYALIQDPSAHTIVNLGYGTGSILTIQLCALGFDILIGRAAVAAGAETQARARLVAADRTADAVQAEYQRRYADLADTIGPLLTTIAAAGGTVSATTRGRAQVEYQRLRALFDHTSAFDHVLLRELQPLIDSAQERGVAVSVSVAGTLPTIADTTARELAHAIAPALAAATVSARITAAGESSSVRLGVICHGVVHPENLSQPSRSSEDPLDLTILDDAVWITVHHQLFKGGFRHNDLAGQPS